MLSFVLSIYILQSSKDKIARYSIVPHLCLLSLRFSMSDNLIISHKTSFSYEFHYIFLCSRFVKETVAEDNLPGGVEKVE